MNDTPNTIFFTISLVFAFTSSPQTQACGPAQEKVHTAAGSVHRSMLKMEFNRMEGSRLERVPNDGEEEEGRKDEWRRDIAISRLLVLCLSYKKKKGSDLENKKK